MRIIAGNYRGKKLYTPVNYIIRPTSDKARESIFNILASKYNKNFLDLKLLDLYAGTGAFGLEAISRGFGQVTLLDIDTANAERNAKLFSKEQSKIKIIKTDALNLKQSFDKYNVVFMDAPYKKGFSSQTLQQLAAKNWLEKNALIIAEVERNEKLEVPEEFELIEERFYGIARFVFLSFK